MVELTEDQIADLHELRQFCVELNTDLVIIGAIAYQYHFPRDERHTSDIDSAVALDLDDFAKLERRLETAKWTQTANREHRWRSSRETLLDLIPAGTELRKAKQMTWPSSQFTMSLVGFDHVFSDSDEVNLAPGLRLKIISPVVLVLLKIVAFLDDQQSRAKDLLDIRSILSAYEEDSERIFSDEVLDAKLADWSFANAFLLGLDLRSLSTLEELAVIHEFVRIIRDEAKPAWAIFVRAVPHFGEKDEEQAWAQFDVFRKGLNRSGKPVLEKGKTSPKEPAISLELYDRRLKIYKTAQQFLGAVLEDYKPELQEIREFAKDTEEVSFLFDETIAAYLNEFLKKAHRLRAVTLRLEKNWSDSAGQQDTELTTWFSEQIEEIQRRFAPYLRPRS